MFKSLENKTLLTASIIFIIINAVFVAFGYIYFTAFPILMLIAWLAIYRLDILLLLTIFLTPLSILLSEFDRYSPVDLSIPAEPLLALITLIFLLKKFTGEKIDKKILYHPISIAIYINFIWIIFTSVSSTLPAVSFKYTLAKLWFIIPLYFTLLIFFKDINFIKKYFRMYIFSLTIVLIYTLSRHIQFGLFEKKVADFVMSPFYKDHTSYGAAIAMYVPVLFGFLFFMQKNSYSKFILIFLNLLFAFALVFSYTRAAWLSIAGAVAVWAIILLRIKLKYLAIGSAIAGTLFFYYQFQITDSLKKNRTDAEENLQDQVTSMTNISTDASNLERINRWNAAIKMFYEKPLSGFGPGTYSFNYAPYQMSYDRTIISTNFGDGGNAHSEYIGPLAEQGIFGLLSFIAIIALTINSAVKTFYNSKSSEIKTITLMSLLGLVTYYLHGFLNNFLDTDKLSVPFWGFTSVIAATEIYFLKTEKEPQKNQSKIS